jgi:hypothetical protein
MARSCSTNVQKISAYTRSILAGKPEGKRPLGRPRRTWVDNIKMDLIEDEMVRIGLIWLRIGTSGGLLWTRLWTFGFLEMLRSSWVAAQLAASQEGLSSMSEYACWSYVFELDAHIFCRYHELPVGDTRIYYQRITLCTLYTKAYVTY